MRERDLQDAKPFKIDPDQPRIETKGGKRIWWEASRCGGGGGGGGGSGGSGACAGDCGCNGGGTCASGCAQCGCGKG